MFGKSKMKIEYLEKLLVKLEAEIALMKTLFDEVQKEKRELWGKLMARDYETYRSYSEDPDLDQLIVDYKPEADILNAGEVLDEARK